MNRENKARLRAIRDGLAEYATEITSMLDEIFPEKISGPTEEQLDSQMGPKDANWTTANVQDIAGPFIKDLTENMSLKDVAITGQICALGELKGYVKKSGEKGMVYNMQIEDPTAKILVVFWDEQCEKAKEFTLGQFIRITNAWKVQKNRFGKLELHPGKFAKFEVVE